MLVGPQQQLLAGDQRRKVGSATNTKVRDRRTGDKPRDDSEPDRHLDLKIGHRKYGEVR
ncbi:hypothetical protein BDP81DRAFT_73452 [Colletotrichum phormii]|uniref:Uncharacterized protein n=1 Tax=Colletotrichum phormii TaxID=359342 RepID=A0AAJ0EBA6_9PEZI|nr:uncharacterized protein BDP81DRAFT_73452 [Colletotrichum phormii]KAK1633412.1 hypothetical protein BDP81DRAFT_73452 [Colletotrichum phormii]